MEIKIPPSKSITHRALICAALARGESTIIHPLVCEDTLTTAKVLCQLGVPIEMKQDFWMVEGGDLQTPEEKLFCGASGTTLRFITALTSLLEIPCHITGDPSLMRRKSKPENHISSQYISGLLLAAPLAKRKMNMDITEAHVSKSYIELTRAVQKEFGIPYKPTTFTVEGDWSSAAFLLAAGVLKKEVSLTGLNPKSLQPDRTIVTILKEMGGDIQWQGDKLVAKKSELKAIDWDFTDTPDLFPIVCVLHACAKGKGRLTGIERLKLKESNRPEEMKKIFKSSSIDSRDHRIIMAAAVLGLVADSPMKFKHPQAVAKSFPDFWNIYEQFLR